MMYGVCETIRRGGNQSRTNIHEFLSIRKGEFIANGGHDRFLTRVEICVAT
jgi:hypothetical protein